MSVALGGVVGSRGEIVGTVLPVTVSPSFVEAGDLVAKEIPTPKATTTESATSTSA